MDRMRFEISLTKIVPVLTEILSNHFINSMRQELVYEFANIYRYMIYSVNCVGASNFFPAGRTDDSDANLFINHAATVDLYRNRRIRWLVG